VTHITFDFDVLGHCGLVDEGGTSVEIVASQAIDHGLDGIECAFVQDEVARHDMDCLEFSMRDEWNRGTTYDCARFSSSV